MKMFVAQLLMSVGLVSCAPDLWGYQGKHNQDHWTGECHGTKQSPIDIDDEDVEFENLGSLQFRSFAGSRKELFLMTNNGHTLQTEFPNLQSELIISHLNETCQFKQVHFHWGKSSYMGSEHTIDKERFAMERHAVYVCMETGRLAVVGKLYRIGEEDEGDRILNNIIDAASKYVRSSRAVKGWMDLRADKMHKFMGFDTEDTIEQYCTYEGSLTTPPCSQVVDWLLQTSIGTITEKNMAKLRMLRHKKDTCPEGKACVDVEMVNNFRTPQPLNNRRVICNGASDNNPLTH